LFPNQEIRFRLGIETFDDEFRKNILNKNFSLSEGKVFENIRNNYWGALLMVCIQGQTKEQILLDIKTATDNFQEITISVFNDNGTVVKQDKELTKWFVEEIYPSLQDKQNTEVLISNQDLGVYVQ
ncbi:MAG: radical SAM protein, partial [Leptotrichiaceae bacterium]